MFIQFIFMIFNLNGFMNHKNALDKYMFFLIYYSYCSENATDGWISKFYLGIELIICIFTADHYRRYSQCYCRVIKTFQSVFSIKDFLEARKIGMPSMFFRAW